MSFSLANRLNECSDVFSRGFRDGEMTQMKCEGEANTVGEEFGEGEDPWV